MFEEFSASQPFDEENNDFFPVIPIEDHDEGDYDESLPEQLPILALKNTVLFPGIVIPITVGRDKSIKAINRAYKDNKVVAVLSQRDPNTEDPESVDLFTTGTVARILKLLRMPDGTTTAILQGRHRVSLVEFLQEDPFIIGQVSKLSYIQPDNALEFEALIASILDLAKEIIELSPNIPSEAMVMLRNINNSSFLLNFIASNLGTKVSTKQSILEIDHLGEKADAILREMNSELKLLELKDKIENKVRGDIEKQQRDYFLNQQLKTIQEELGQNPQEEEIRLMMVRAKEKDWPNEADKTFQKEMNKLRRMNPQVAEYAIQMNYLELLLDLPWNKHTRDNFDLHKVKKVLDKDHFGLEKVKERILEHLAVLKLKGDMKAPILCLVGPPGVGKNLFGQIYCTRIKTEIHSDVPWWVA